MMESLDRRLKSDGSSALSLVSRSDAASDGDARGGSRPVAGAALKSILVVDGRTLIRDCLVRCLAAALEGVRVQGVASTREWEDAPQGDLPVSLVLVCAQGRKTTELEIGRSGALSGRLADVPVILLSDVDDFGCILGAIEQGARGYVPTSVPFDVAIGAIRLVQAGGTFVPASSVLGSRNGRADATRASARGAAPPIFTERQAAIVESLRQGKANKMIAYELNMCESTVKVHVRNIMKKLKARNRTEIVYKTIDLFENRSGD